jgi:hypothetical protein
MTVVDNSSKLPAPYMSFGVFTKSIETFADTTVPTGPLDRRVLNEFSGADYGALISGLRFLGLVDEQRRATAEYRDLVQLSKDPAKFKERWRELVKSKYTPVVGQLDLKHGTSAELEKAFKDYGVSTGQMLTKTIRFFIKAVSESGLQLSPYMTAPKPRAPRTTSATARKNGSGKVHGGTKPRGQDSSNEAPDETPSGFERLPLPGMPNSFIQYPTNLTEAHCQILEAMVGVLRTSVKARTGGKGTKP